MTNFIAALKYLPLIPEAIAEGSLISAAIKDPTAENLNAAISEADQLAKDFFPGIEPKRLDAGCAILLAGVTLEGGQSAEQIESVLAVVAIQLPVALNLPFEISITQKP